MAIRRNLAAFGAGILFALGLGIGGMTDPWRIFGFLDISGALGAWDPTLAFVMVGALATYALAYRLALRRAAPLFVDLFELPRRRDIDGRLVVGAAIFGAGWGLSGFCPGPGLTSLTSGNSAVLVFLAAMTMGMLGHKVVQAGRLQSTRRP